MAHMSDERRKEMEEEMSRFELEIAGPGEIELPISSGIVSKAKPMLPPPAPPTVAALIPEVLKKAPPPPPPPSSPPLQTPLRPPPAPPISVISAPSPSSGSVRFIPHQLHRQPRPHPRPNFMGMRGPDMGGPFGPFGPHLGPRMGPPHMSHGGPMHGPLPPGAPMHPGGMMLPMHPGGMGMPPCPPIPMGNMNMGVNLPVPPGFCPPGTMAHSRFESQSYNAPHMNQNAEAETSTSCASSESSSTVESAPTVYAAPFMKSQPEIISESNSSNGQSNVSVLSVPSSVQKMEKLSSVKAANEQSSVSSPVTHSQGTEETVTTKKREKKKKIVRMAGGQAWEDNSLLEWENDDFRIFCGDLGNDVTDEVLIRAFSKYSSFVKAKVIRDKRTNKTKGFGFVSFKDPQDFIKAMREMNGRYVGSRPIKLRKSTWRDRNMDIVKKKQREKEKLGLL